MSKTLGMVVGVFFLIVAGGYALATVADAATPGDTLYPIDLITEEVQRSFTTDNLALAELEQDFFEERSKELDEMIKGNTDEYSLDVALQQLEKQRVRTQQRVLTLTSDANNYDEAKKAEVTQRFEKLVQKEVQRMDQVQNQYMKAGEDAQKRMENTRKGMEESIERLNNLEIDLNSEGNGQGNTEGQFGKESSADGVKDREGNSDETVGNSTAPKTGR